MPNLPVNNHGSNKFALVQGASIRELDGDFNASNLEWLTDAELARYQSITSSSRKQQFLAGHFLVRKMASNVFKNLPHDWTYFQDAESLRRLKGNTDSLPELFVSISHSGEWIAAAISDAPIGIDIETFSKQRDFIAIAKHVFSNPEICHLKFCDDEELKQNFYLYWTLKECVAKQYGTGLKFERSRLESPVLVYEGDQASMQSWQCPDYVIALASEALLKVETQGLCDNAKHQSWKNTASGQ